MAFSNFAVAMVSLCYNYTCGTLIDKVAQVLTSRCCESIFVFSLFLDLVVCLLCPLVVGFFWYCGGLHRRICDNNYTPTQHWGSTDYMHINVDILFQRQRCYITINYSVLLSRFHQLLILFKTYLKIHCSKVVFRLTGSTTLKLQHFSLKRSEHTWFGQLTLHV